MIQPDPESLLQKLADISRTTTGSNTMLTVEERTEPTSVQRREHLTLLPAAELLEAKATTDISS